MQLIELIFLRNQLKTKLLLFRDGFGTQNVSYFPVGSARPSFNGEGKQVWSESVTLAILSRSLFSLLNLLVGFHLQKAQQHKEQLASQ